ncbi:UNVERIFIED_CONTAM: hypothetical protein Sradi_5976000 [Sesamum radiatum]|uniref:DUF7705 domain-containing protein n=1 Tax=Sesamum radiatum TaxID=300843 RepID=A0AAW2KH01_SESRA
MAVSHLHSCRNCIQRDHILLDNCLVKNQLYGTVQSFGLLLSFTTSSGSTLLSSVSISSGQDKYVSAVGDSEMRRDGLRLAIEAWNQCNEVGEEAPGMGSPRAADCFDIYKASPQQGQTNQCSLCNLLPYILVHRVTEKENRLGVGNLLWGCRMRRSITDLYAAEKELYLGSKCQVEDTPKPWQFWMIMLKSGNMDTYAARCPKNGHKVGLLVLMASSHASAEGA